MKPFVAALIVLTMFATVSAQDVSGGGAAAVVGDTPVADVSGGASGTSASDTTPATVAEIPQKPVEEKPAVKPVKPVEKPAAKPAEKPVAKAVVKTEPEPAAEASNTAGSLEFVDVTAADFTARRIPELKLDAVKPRIAAETSDTVVTSSPEKGFFSISKKTIDYITKGLIALVLVLIVVVLRMRDRKKRRRVFRVKNR